MDFDGFVPLAIIAMHSSLEPFSDSELYTYATTICGVERKFNQHGLVMRPKVTPTEFKFDLYASEWTPTPPQQKTLALSAEIEYNDVFDQVWQYAET
jgi:hypothetical protein